ncbi:proline--tRNA ligase [candidate division KSB1 bacterium]|nr:proline--tRNA ligase [candidate division KSB1 bacterium]
MAKGIAKRSEDYSRWYTDVIAAAKLADYSPIKGCMVIRPNGYALWERMQAALDKMFKETGHVNAYFPLFIPESFMKKEAEHVEGFAPECAVVTHGGGKKLEEPLIIRPTSETIIWSMYKKWIQSYRDLPILINQWANVVRWEMRTRLFLRTTEFLWQEGHTAHATAEEAEQETLKLLDVYTRFAKDYMAIPVIRGVKTEREKFAGALRTYCIEAMMQDKKALQAGTSHNLGQNFAKAFDVTFQDERGNLDFVYATSWGVSTRLIGAIIMSHGDDEGVIMPPKLAPIQVVIVPIWKSETEKNLILQRVEQLSIEWNGRFSFHVDEREGYRPGWKYNEWEQYGVPIRIEIGPKDLEQNHVILVRRDTQEKQSVEIGILTTTLEKTLDAIQMNLYKRSLKFREENSFYVDDYSEFKKQIEDPSGFFWLHWCGSPECENRLQEETKATIRCIPIDDNVCKEKGRCVICGGESNERVIVAKAY